MASSVKRPLLVYLPDESRKKIDVQADEEGTSASAIARRVLLREYPVKTR